MKINFRAFATAAFFLLFYTGARAQNVNKQSFSFQGNVFQQFIVPATGWYYLSTSGGQGGGASNGSHTGGLGATIEGYMQLQVGDTLRIAVAGQGGVGSNDGNNVSGGGGGGSSSIIKIKNKNYIPLLFAAGGGGGNANADGSPGDASQIGSGQGGAVSASPFGGASGAGYFTDGGTHFDGGTLMSYGGQAYLSGNFGGNSGNLGGDGGWGGGGEGGPAKNRFLSNHDGGGGGGGGYDGGVGSDNNGGNGGYSFISDSLNTNFRVRLKGANSGNGKVSLERVQYPNTSSQESIFNFQGNVFQTWTVPASGIYHFDVSGAQGGDCMGAPGGKGARMQGKVALIAGDVLRIAVGGQGGAGSSVAPATWGGFSSGGGGGGSSIFKVVGNQLVPLMIAGGGGGSTFRVQDNWYLPADSAEIAFNNFSLGGAGQASSDNNGQGGSIDFRNNVKLTGFATLLKGDAVPAGSGGGLFSSGASWSGFTRTDSSYRPASGGQSYFQGNYGGSGNLGADGGWGGGGEGNTFGYFTQDPIFVTKFGIAAAGDPWGYNPGYYLWGNGGGGGGYSGGSSAGNYLKLDNSHYLSRGGAGGYSYSIASCRNDSSGAQMGNGVIRIAGPTVLVDTVSVVSPTYTWPVNGVTYRHSGTYNYLDQSNCAYRVLNLTIGGLGGCLNYKRIDTTIVSCGSYTSPLNGRTYTENMIDSFEVGCNRYVVKLITSAPATFQEQALPLEVCKDKTISYSIPEVPFATSYQWTLPSGISGSSKTNKIVLKIRDNFKGGTICVSPVNSCGVGKAICRQINVLKDEPKGSLIISGPPAPYISGNYSVTPIKGATTYTWKLSNSQARIVSGQGTAQIQLEAGPGFVGTELSVRASNCEGKGTKTEIVLGTVKEDDDDDDDDDEKDSKKFVNIKGTEAIDLANSKGMGIGATPISISAYPNPTSGKLTVQLPTSAQQGRLEVYNKDGQLVQTLKVPARAQSIPIDLSTKAKGFYLIRYYAGQEMKSIKVVVK